MKAPQAVTTRTEFDPLMVGFKRAHRLVEKEKWTKEDVDRSLFAHAAESELSQVLVEAKTLLPSFVAEGRVWESLECAGPDEACDRRIF